MLSVNSNKAEISWQGRTAGKAKILVWELASRLLKAGTLSCVQHRSRLNKLLVGCAREDTWLRPGFLQEKAFCGGCPEQLFPVHCSDTAQLGGDTFAS